MARVTGEGYLTTVSLLAVRELRRVHPVVPRRAAPQGPREETESPRPSLGASARRGTFALTGRGSRSDPKVRVERGVMSDCDVVLQFCW